MSLGFFGGYLNLRLIFVWVYISFVAHFIWSGGGEVERGDGEGMGWGEAAVDGGRF